MKTTELPKILFISPTFPGGFTNGLSMRAAMWLSVLQQKYEIYLLVIPVADGNSKIANLKLSKLCKSIVIAKPSLLKRIAWCIMRIFTKKTYADQILGDKFLLEASKEFWQIKFDAIHVLRAYLRPAVEPFIKKLPPTTILTLDLDDIESITNQRLAELYHKYGLRRATRQHQKLSKDFKSVETQITQQFNQVFVCSNLDASRLNNSGTSQITVIPNSLPSQTQNPKLKKSSAVFYFLFVGNFQYFPNQDAINWLASEIIPKMRTQAKKAFVMQIIGSGKLPNSAKLEKVPELKIIQDVLDLKPYYHSADVVIAPIRAGGGTRIKIIEAFSFNLPVVSTSIGIEGIDAIHNKHALIADNSADFANYCLELINNSSLRDSIALQGAKLFREHYCADIVHAKAVSMLVTPLLSNEQTGS